MPVLEWTKVEVTRMNRIELLQYAIVGKFTQGWPDLKDLRKNLPTQCGIKGHCKIGLLRYRHILIRCALVGNFIKTLSKNVYYITNRQGTFFPMRPLFMTQSLDGSRNYTVRYLGFLPKSVTDTLC